MKILTTFKYSVLMMFLTVTLIACSPDNETGVTDVKWDRDACKRCQMMLSEHNFAAQIRVFPKDKRSKIYKFDDMGCAALWLLSDVNKPGSDEKQRMYYKNDPKTEIWVADYKTNQWIDARKAWFIKVPSTPMNYGLGAQVEKINGAMNFEQAVKHFNEVEEKLNIHGGNLAH